jgi:hypothetical protein
MRPGHGSPGCWITRTILEVAEARAFWFINSVIPSEPYGDKTYGSKQVFQDDSSNKVKLRQAITVALPIIHIDLSLSNYSPLRLKIFITRSTTS